MKNFIKILIIGLILQLISSYVKADNRVTSNDIVVVLVNKNTCSMSRKLEQLLQTPTIKNIFNNYDIQLFVYYGQDVETYRQKMGVKWYPMAFRLKKIAGVWCVVDKLDPHVTNPITLQYLIKFLGFKPRRQQPPSKTPTLPGGS